MGPDLPLHPDLLCEPLLVEQLGLESAECLGLPREDVGLSGLLLPAALFGVHTLAEPLLVQFDVVVLRHLLINIIKGIKSAVIRIEFIKGYFI